MRSVRRADVFVDVCTQRDYLGPGGAHPSLNGRNILPNLKRLMALLRWAKLPVLSCVEARRPEDVRGLPRPECVIGTTGQQKLPCTLMPRRTWVDSDNCLCVSLDILSQSQQVILDKAHRDPFTNPKLDRLLTELPARRFLLFGVALETSIRLLALGLILRHRNVAVVWDACGWWDAEEGDMTLRQLAAKGCELVSTHQIVEATLAAARKPVAATVLRHRSVA